MSLADGSAWEIEFGHWGENVQVGSKIRFSGERQSYTVQARGRRYAVCTKPFNARKTVLYTVLDFREHIRGTENLIFGMGAETREQCEAMLLRLEAGVTEVSRRNRVSLSVVT